MAGYGPDERPVRNREAAFRRMEGHEVVILPSGASTHVLNPAGSLIFEMLDGRHTVNEIVAAIRDEYEVDEERARTDLAEFLAELESLGMMSARPAPRR
jgi:hypothetical protein